MKTFLSTVALAALLSESTAFVLQNHGTTKVAPLFGKRMKFQPPPKVVDQTEYIQVKANGEDAWKTMDIVDILERGGLGVLPTDTGYCFVTPLSSRQGLERLYRIQNMEGYEAPVHLLCGNLKTIDEHCFNIDKTAFKILKKNLPGMYTFILPGKTTLPREILQGNKQLQTVGVRMPADPIIRYLQDELLYGMPLLVSSVGGDNNEEDEYHSEDKRQTRHLVHCIVEQDSSWCNEVDFIVDAGGRPQAGSTVYDLTRRGDPTLVREGLGELELAQ